MAAEQFEKMTHERMPVFKMENGDLLYIQYNKEKDTFDVGTVTNTAMIVKNSFPYDHNFTLDSNLQGVHEQLSEMEEYRVVMDKEEQCEAEQESQVTEEEHHFRRGR